MPLDVANTHENTNFHMTVMWYIVFMSSLFYMTVVLPFGLYYTETDEEKAFVSQFFLSDMVVVVAHLLCF